MLFRRKSRRGFTLIEVLVAFVILAFSLGALFSVFSDSLRSVRRSGEYAQATAIAQAHLARIEAAGPTGADIEEGEDEAGYRWRVEIVEARELAVETGKTGVVPVEVSVTVSWGVTNARSVTLTTLRAISR